MVQCLWLAHPSWWCRRHNAWMGLPSTPILYICIAYRSLNPRILSFDTFFKRWTRQRFPIFNCKLDMTTTFRDIVIPMPYFWFYIWHKWTILPSCVSRDGIPSPWQDHREFMPIFFNILSSLIYTQLVKMKSIDESTSFQEQCLLGIRKISCCHSIQIYCAW